MRLGSKQVFVIGKQCMCGDATTVYEGNYCMEWALVDNKIVHN